MSTCPVRSVPCQILRIRTLVAACSVLALLQTFDSLSSYGSEPRRTAVVKAVEGAHDSVVNIHGQKTLPAEEDPLSRGEGPHKVNGMGTGIVIDERGYIITNFHVVDGVRKLEVSLADGS